MMIGLMATNDSQIAESILDFFLAISDIPVVERPVPLQVWTLTSPFLSLIGFVRPIRFPPRKKTRLEDYC